MHIKSIAVASAIAGSMLWASTAGAATVSIGFSSTDGSFTTEGTGSGSASANTSFGSFTSVQVTATGQPILSLPTILDSNSINVAGSSGTLYIAVTEQGLTSPVPGFLSSFTANAVTSGWTVTESTFLDTGNGLYTQITPLNSAVFTAIGTSVSSQAASSGSSYSVTELYEIQATSSGNSNDTIDLSATPLPAALPLFASGLGFLGFAGWRKRRKDMRGLPSVAAA